jgi:peptide/nickel transport system substrate-binding protein
MAVALCLSIWAAVPLAHGLFDGEADGLGERSHLDEVFLSAELVRGLPGASQPSSWVRPAGVARSAARASLHSSTLPDRTPTDQTPADRPSTYQEAPTLRAEVDRGALPPVEERLPETPLVVTPADTVGQYGGTWRFAMLDSGQFPILYRNMGWEHLVRWNQDYLTVSPNLAQSYVVSDDGAEYTFRLRRGLRWSDGAPFTADDIMFWYQDIARNDRLAFLSAAYTRGGEMLAVEKVDRHTIKIILPEPDGLFLNFLAGPYGGFLTRFPKHYLKQFHPAYNPTGIDSLIAEHGADDWVDLFSMKAPVVPFLQTWATKPDLPTMHPWQLETAYGATTQVVAQRNPYYWKVDPAGNQLPYLDRVVHELYGNQETILLRMLNGDFGFLWINVNELKNKSVLYDNRAQGDYHFTRLRYTQANTVALALNLTHPDSTQRAIFNAKSFRAALSHAINRQEIIDLVYMGQGQPRQVAPLRESAFYNRQLAQQFVDYDPDRANELLDEAGFAARDSDGYRLGPDGERISFVLEVTDATEMRFPDVAELICTYWRDVGIDANFRILTRTYFLTRRLANQHDAIMWKAPGGRGSDVMMDAKLYLPIARGSHMFVPWGLWYESGGRSPYAAKPEGAAWRQVQLYEAMKSEPDAAQRREIMRDILQIAADEFYTIGISSRTDGFAVVKNSFRNVPSVMTFAWKLGTPKAYDPSLFFIEDGAL